MKKLTIVFFVLAFMACNQNEKWKDSSLPAEERAEALIKEMTLQEKVRQMNMTRGDYLKTDDKMDEEKIKQQIGTIGLGSIHDFYPKTAEEYNVVQRHTIENSRLHIPVMLMEEMLHGYHTDGATVFPMPLAMGASWNKELMHSVGKVIGTEARVNGAHVALGPTLGIAREPRWGRVAELYSEDTHLATEMGYNLIVGMGGQDPSSPFSMIAGPKHFAVHSAPITGSNASPVLLGERTSRTDFLPVFEKAVKEGGALNLMSSYSELDGVPCTGNKWLLTDVIRGEWDFKGFTVSDLGAMRFLWNVHHYAENPRDAIKKATEAGLDMQFYDFPDSMYQATLVDLVESGEMEEKYIDRAVKGILYTKFVLGLFENPYITQDRIDKYYHSKENQKVAYDIASESIVLLENDGILPLEKNKHKKIAVLGPLAAEAELGGYTHASAEGVSILEGLKKASPNTTFTYEKAANIVERGTAIQPKYLFHDNGKKGLKASFYNNMELKGEPVLEMIHDNIDFEWPWNPYPGVEDDFFSVRWEGYIKTDVDVKGWVGTTSDDGARIYINDELVLDAWAGSTPIKKAPYEFKKGKKYKLKYEYYDNQWHATASLRWSKKDNGIQNAVRLAKEAELSIIVVGENTKTVNENRDVAHLGLSGNQLEMIQAVAKVGKPYVVVLQNGRPLSTNWVSKNANALVEGWFAGEQGGYAIADMLFGEVNPSGKMPISVAKSVGQLPVYYNQKPTTIYRYVDEDDKRLYNFGYGLSYSSFEYGEPKVSVNENNGDFKVTVSVDVKNTSKVDGKETVQLYVRDMISSVTVPPLSLKAFDKKLIKAGETITYSFELGKEDLKLWNQDKEWAVEAGQFNAMVGPSSSQLQTIKFELNKSYKL
ncbi:glycoside hydrolase family 3 C-terminal domain-containing protein [Flammeovirga yaeyamensis]|uniref:Glycoside hydrolase family 3 C-terminal domain-containing protein n=1 Tax=Flammeovirga yaeyamensis TaxID=367791 RepID=A0AAX1NAI3_9BACT|nr:glycoside hydrolase family 3 N-terminal domain-containing protein [Flammeovirga yaeyamensis]MBB3699368.1 beta-glucosidase [Flammeovirga yaeyamensis]NMF35372.1 glycoside hydrolase family 3 [Flammeovirga yaeyamensis]QWG04232.1 glycoside hydrolase family 3 C-terminal domain-containing protein [Flammeovirga yaeyamensis]